MDMMIAAHLLAIGAVLVTNNPVTSIGLRPRCHG
jgi:predicted nucleic acid-binding protein